MGAPVNIPLLEVEVSEDVLFLCHQVTYRELLFCSHWFSQSEVSARLSKSDDSKAFVQLENTHREKARKEITPVNISSYATYIGMIGGRRGYS